MFVAKTIAGLRDSLQLAVIQKKKIGFVPTMGALHQGHLSLISRAVAENDVVVSSIFVNPIQFNNPEDLAKYPRTFEQDAKMLESAGCDVLFYPSVDEMYPEPVTKVYDFGQLDKVMEGRFRPGHFNGVAIVVHKLFNMVRPYSAYFGEKDFQQLAVIKKMVEMEQLDVQIIPCPIVREKDGLAMSSRNVRLGKAERALAPFIYQTLQSSVKLSGTASVSDVISMVKSSFAAHPEFALEYFNLVDCTSLSDVNDWNESACIIGCIAVHLGGVRLIDNMMFRPA